jgi:hypothetical protein
MKELNKLRGNKKEISKGEKEYIEEYYKILNEEIKEYKMGIDKIKEEIKNINFNPLEKRFLDVLKNFETKNQKILENLYLENNELNTDITNYNNNNNLSNLKKSNSMSNLYSNNSSISNMNKIIDKNNNSNVKIKGNC